MDFIKKIARNIKRMANSMDPLKAAGIIFIGKINRREYLKPPFAVFNERPVEYRFVFEQITKYYPATVLDIGTGTTALPSLMANCGCKVTAIDNVKDYWPKGMFNRHYHVINDDITNSQLKETFSMITCVSTLEHIKDCDSALRTMSRLLESDGCIVLTFPYNERKGVLNVYTLPEAKIKSVPDFPTRAYSRDDLNGWCEEYGLEIIEQEYWQFYTDEYWTTGDRLKIPKKTSANEKHQISCVLLRKC